MDLDEMLRVDRCQDMDELMHAFSHCELSEQLCRRYVRSTECLSS